MTREHNGALRARRRRIVRCALVLPPLLIVGAVFAHSHRRESNRLAPLEVRKGAAMSWLVEHVAHMRLPDTRQVIDSGVEEAFRPVYASVPSFLDWYYSPRGRLTQAGWRVVEIFDDLWEWSKNLFGAENTSRGPSQSVDPVRQEINERLFGGHAMRIAALEQDIDSVLRGEVSAGIEAFLQREAASVLPKWRAEYRDMLQLVQDDIERRIDASVPPLAIAAVLTGTAAQVATAALSRMVARRMSSGMGARIARGLGRAAAPATAAAGGLAAQDSVQLRSNYEPGHRFNVVGVSPGSRPRPFVERAGATDTPLSHGAGKGRISVRSHDECQSRLSSCKVWITFLLRELDYAWLARSPAAETKVPFLPPSPNQSHSTIPPPAVPADLSFPPPKETPVRSPQTIPRFFAACWTIA